MGSRGWDAVDDAGRVPGSGVALRHSRQWRGRADEWFICIDGWWGHLAENGRQKTILKEDDIPGFNNHKTFWVPNPIAAFIDRTCTLRKSTSLRGYLASSIAPVAQQWHMENQTRAGEQLLA
jgi:hypothetical protein